MLNQGVVGEQSRVCFGQVGDLLSWTAFSTSCFLIFVGTDDIPAMCKGFDKCVVFMSKSPNYCFISQRSFSVELLIM